MERKFHTQLLQKEYFSIQELHNELKKNVPEEKDFGKAIGYEGSLNYCISQIKSALVYPGGLPILLKGEAGSGKTYLMKLIHEYCINNSLLKDIRKIQRVKLNQLPLDKQCERLEELLNALTGGILYLENIAMCSEQLQERLAEYITNAARKKENVRLVMGTDEKSYPQISKKLLFNIPVICDIPSLAERNEDERKAFVIMFFKDEQERLDKTIYLSENLMHKLMNYQFEHNIAELKQTITLICANAYAQQHTDDTLEVFLYNLPARMQGAISMEKKDAMLLRLDVIQLDSAADKILEMWKNLLESYRYVISSGKGFDAFLDSGKKTLKYYYDILIFQESFSDERLGPMEKIVMEMISNIHNIYNVNFPVNCAYVISRMMIAQHNHNSKIQVWDREHREEVQKIYNLMVENMPDINYLTEILSKQIQMNTSMELLQLNKVFIMINIHSYNQKLKIMDTAGVILCHGYTTASSIADTVNTILQVQLFEAIDMPIGSSINDVIQKLSLFIKENSHYKNIILMVDTGALEDLGQVIDGTVNLGIINNVSTILALNIAEKMLAGEKMQDILEGACKENQCKYIIFSHTKKEKAIIFASDAGKNIAEKLTRLFKDSLPKPIPLEMVAYDYEALYKNGCEDIIFEKYNVELLIKTLNLKIPGIKSATLEEIINFNNIDVVNEVLASHLSAEEIEEFNQALLKNFSLQSVLENLTILNAKKLLEHVNDATTLLQQMLKRKFLSKTIIGINMHICFLIERLVTKTPIETYEGIDEFIQNHQNFIRIVKESFCTLLGHYNVEIPVNEIAYLYEYICSDYEMSEEDKKCQRS
ncbi:PRD domain-containing protein [Lactonifactor longoviformis]|nr:PRD domain-containing protein [Lactonifactor longoviformis]